MTTVTVQGRILSIVEDIDRRNNKEFINPEQIDEDELFDQLDENDFLIM